MSEMMGPLSRASARKRPSIPAISNSKPKSSSESPSSSDNKLLPSYFGLAETRICRGERFNVAGRRLDAEGDIQYLIEWEQPSPISPPLLLSSPNKALLSPTTADASPSKTISTSPVVPKTEIKSPPDSAPVMDMENKASPLVSKANKEEKVSPPVDKVNKEDKANLLVDKANKEDKASLLVDESSPLIDKDRNEDKAKKCDLDSAKERTVSRTDETETSNADDESRASEEIPDCEETKPNLSELRSEEPNPDNVVEKAEENESMTVKNKSIVEKALEQKPLERKAEEQKSDDEEPKQEQNRVEEKSLNAEATFTQLKKSSFDATFSCLTCSPEPPKLLMEGDETDDEELKVGAKCDMEEKMDVDEDVQSAEIKASAGADHLPNGQDDKSEDELKLVLDDAEDEAVEEVKGEEKSEVKSGIKELEDKRDLKEAQEEVVLLEHVHVEEEQINGKDQVKVNGVEKVNGKDEDEKDSLADFKLEKTEDEEMKNILTVDSRSKDSIKGVINAELKVEVTRLNLNDLD